LGVFGGKVVPFFETTRSTPEITSLKVPQIGWNRLHFPRPSRLFEGVEEGARVYFVHSYYPAPSDATLTSATSDYGVPFCCAVERGNVAATQFHPEKSGAVGLQMLRNFVGWR
jgi:glutamine amidotransferase